MTKNLQANNQPDQDHKKVVTVTFGDNNLARELFGYYHQNLAMIERDLNVEAATRGNCVTIKGTEDAVAMAHNILTDVYGRLESGQKTIEGGDIQSAIRHAQATPKKQTEKNKSENGRSAKTIVTPKKTIRARTPTQSTYIKAMQNASLVFGIGPAGTGKTWLAVAHATAMLQQNEAERIIFSRPAVEAGEQLGFLPGDMKEKVDPYLRPLYDALYDMMPANKVERAIEAGIIEIAPLAFMRGRTLAHSVIILDEAQNTTSMQMKMFLTRLGEGSKMIVTGDPSQTDLNGNQVSGLNEATKLLGNMGEVEVVKFDAGDVARHGLVSKIIKAYQKEQKTTK